MTRRQAIGPAAIAAVVVAAVVVAAVGFGSGARPAASGDPGASAGVGAGASASRSGIAGVTAQPTVRPVPRHELFGFVPYWEMNDGIAEHLAKTPLTTLALFSVTHTKSGKLDTGQTGYKRITGATGERLIREAHGRDIAVQLDLHELRSARATSGSSAR